MTVIIPQCCVPGPGTYRRRGTLKAANQSMEARVFRWAVICLVISLVAGGLGLTNVSAFAKRLSMIFFVLFLLGFLALLGFAYLVAGAVSHSELLPAMVAISV